MVDRAACKDQTNVEHTADAPNTQCNPVYWFIGLLVWHLTLLSCIPFLSSAPLSPTPSSDATTTY